MAYKIVLLSPAEKALLSLPDDTKRRVSAEIDALAENPRHPGVIKLAGRPAYRVRVGDFRIVFAIKDAELIVLVLDIARRDKAYRKNR